ncbi:MAG: rod-determining factor RdfA [Haloarcula sp.]
MTSDSSDATVGTTKIDRVIEKYALDGMAEELEHRWLGTGNMEQSSTRELADYYNKEVLRSAIRESDVFTLGGDVEQVYDALTDDEDTDATLVRTRLEQGGVDVETVMDDFISHQTVYRYLKQHRGVEQSKKSPEEQLEDTIDTVQQLQGRTTAVTEQSIQNLKNKGIVSVGEFSILNDIQALCEDCGRSYEVTSLLKQGSCKCHTE